MDINTNAIFKEILVEHPELAKNIAIAYNELGADMLNDIIRQEISEFVWVIKKRGKG